MEEVGVTVSFNKDVSSFLLQQKNKLKEECTLYFGGEDSK